MRHLIIAQLLMHAFIGISVPLSAKEAYWLVIGSYRQGPGGRPEVSGITSPSVFAIPMDNIKQCEEAGKKISEEIYMPVWQFDNRWTCVSGGRAK